jgi:hypothetical protein
LQSSEREDPEIRARPEDISAAIKTVLEILAFAHKRLFVDGVGGFILALFVNKGGIEGCDFGLKKAWEAGEVEGVGTELRCICNCAQR